MSTALTAYFANAASTTLTAANQLYANNGGSPATNATYTVFGTSTGWVELQPQGSTQTPVGSIGAPSGKGFLWDVTTLEAQQLISGNYSGFIRLNASQFSGGTGLTQAGTLTADIVVRVYKRSSGGTYTNIVTMTLTAQSITSAFATYTLPTVAGSTTNFTTGDKLYIDAWANVTANANGSTAQGIRFNRLTTDTTTFVGDTAANVVTPGYQAGSSTSSATVTESAAYSESLTAQEAATITDAANYTEAQQNSVRVSITESSINTYSVVAAPVSFQGVTTKNTTSESFTAQEAAKITESAAYSEAQQNSISTQVSTSNAATDSVTTAGLAPTSATDPAAQMLYDDLQIQYSRLMGNIIYKYLQFIGTTYYTSQKQLRAFTGELDALFTWENIQQLHVMRSINDVSAFLQSYEYVANVLNDSPFAYYRLNDTLGTSATDIAGNNFAGAITGGVTLGQPGPLAISADTAMLLDGSSGYITLPKAVNPANWAAGITVEAWVKLSNNTFTGYERLVSSDFAQSSNVGFEVIIAPSSDGASGYFTLGFGSSHSNTSFGTGVLAANTWYHICCTYDRTTITIYLNGASIRTASASGAIAATANPITIGRNLVTGNYLPGTVGQCGFYPYALSSGRVLAHYNAATSP